MDGNRSTVDSDAALAVDPATQQYVGRWNQLVSTTNWEKGRIIIQWRDALIESNAPPSEYSDEAWSRLVGSVTGQHVGRLRRVYQRFGEVYGDYDGLYWSHFQAALDWDDAEMWLEGVVQNSWSVSQMRRQRWETLGGDLETEPREDEIVAAELDEDFEAATGAEPIAPTISGKYEEVSGNLESEKPDSDPSDSDEGVSDGEIKGGAAIYADEREEESIKFVRPFENLGELPEDMAEAFEAFKLAILRHKTDDWRQISCDDVLASLDALKELALAPTAENAPF